jgi:hypothetical protein
VFGIDVQSGDELFRITSPEPHYQTSFGRALTQAGNYLAVADAEADIPPNTRDGTLYIYDTITQSLLHTVRNPQPGPFDWFGSSMAAANGLLFVAAQSASAGDQGVVYSIDPATGNYLHTIPSPTTGFGFGYELEAYQDDLFVTARGEVIEQVEAGGVYRYSATDYSQMLHIENPHPRQGSRFGDALDADQGQLLVGAPGARGDKAYLFNADTGALLMTFQDPAPDANSSLREFGASVALWNGYAVIGVPGENSLGQLHVGAAYVFDTKTGAIIDILENPTPLQGEMFASNGGGQEMGMLVVGDKLLIAAADRDIANGRTPGAVYVYSIVPEPSALSRALLSALLLGYTRRHRARFIPAGGCIGRER